LFQTSITGTEAGSRSAMAAAMAASAA